MVLSEDFEDEEVINQLREYFDDDEAWSINFKAALSQITDLDNYSYLLKIKKQYFIIDKETGAVSEAW